MHITVPWEKVRNDIAVVIPVPKDKRSLFVVPWGRSPTARSSTPTSAPPTPTTTARSTTRSAPTDDIDYVLRALNASITTGVTEADITGVWAGLRPLVKSAVVGPHRRPVAPPQGQPQRQRRHHA